MLASSLNMLVAPAGSTVAGVATSNDTPGPMARSVDTDPSWVSSTDRVSGPFCAVGRTARVTVMSALRVGSIGGNTHCCWAVGVQDGWPATWIELTVTPAGVVTVNRNGVDGCPPLFVAVSVRVPVPPAVGCPVTCGADRVRWPGGSGGPTRSGTPLLSVTGIVRLPARSEASGSGPTGTFGPTYTPRPVITGLGVYVGPKVPVGPLPLASDLAGNRTMPITDSNGVPLRVGQPLPPGHLTLSAPQVTGQPTAGGTGTLTLTATNSGGQPSTPLPFTVTTPAGVTVSSIQVAGQPSCTPTAQQQCVLPPIDPTRSADITVTLAVLPTAQNGPLTLSVEDTHDGSVSTDLAIGPGVSLLVATPATVLPAGATSTLRLEASLRPGVTDPGPITFPLQDDGVYVNGYPPNCRSTGAAIECSGPHIDGLVLFVSRNHQLGALPLQARFAGGQTLAIADSEGRLVQVGAPVPPAHLALSGLQPGEPTIAGGAGTVTLTATNDGGEKSQPTPITVTTPPGVAVARIDPAGWSR